MLRVILLRGNRSALPLANNGTQEILHSSLFILHSSFFTSYSFFLLLTLKRVKIPNIIRNFASEAPTECTHEYE
jgi:hypothetical protein